MALIKEVIFLNLVEEVQTTEVWKFFKSFGAIIDIFIPRRKDRFGKKFGFVTTKNNLEARNILIK